MMAISYAIFGMSLTQIYKGRNKNGQVIQPLHNHLSAEYLIAVVAVI
jgi:hypothetical protein